MSNQSQELGLRGLQPLDLLNVAGVADGKACKMRDAL